MHIFASTLEWDCTLAIPHYIYVYIPFVHLNENIFYIFDKLSIIKMKRFRLLKLYPQADNNITKPVKRL